MSKSPRARAPLSPLPPPRFRDSLAAVLILALAGACSSNPGVKSETKEGAEDPMANVSGAGPRHDLETVAILGTNDIHGGLVPMQLKSREPEGGKPVEYQSGGAA